MEELNHFINQHDAAITGGVLVLMVAELIRGKIKPSYVFAGVVFIFLILGYVDIDMILQAAITKSVLIIFMVVALSSIINKHVNLGFYFDKVLGGIVSPIWFLGVLCLLVALISSVFNNTPVVIILIPYMMQKAEKYGVSPSKFLIPLSFAAIFGGMITLIGTSTNLVLNGLLEGSGLAGFGFIDFLIPGLLVTISGIAYLITIGYRILPSRSMPFARKRDEVRKYFIEARIGSDSKLSGLPLSESGLKDLKGVSLIELVRENRTFEVVASRNMILQENDRLIFSGSLADVMQINAEAKNIEFSGQDRVEADQKLAFVELSIPTNSSLDGKKVNQTNFRERYGATILAVHRNSEDLSGRIGEMELKSGDLLIVVPHVRLSEAIKTDFYILSNLIHERTPSKKKWMLLGGIALITLLAVGFQIGLFLFLGLILSLVVILRFTAIEELKNEFRLNLYVILIASLLVGDVFIRTGLADVVSGGILQLVVPFGFQGIVVGLMLFTVLLTSFITNVAAVSIAFPLAYSISQSSGIAGEALFLAVAFAASAAFMTPIGYQTNLLIMAPGDYQFKDFWKVGAPLTALYLGVVLLYLTLCYT